MYKPMMGGGGGGGLVASRTAEIVGGGVGGNTSNGNTPPSNGSGSSATTSNSSGSTGSTGGGSGGGGGGSGGGDVVQICNNNIIESSCNENNNSYSTHHHCNGASFNNHHNNILNHLNHQAILTPAQPFNQQQQQQQQQLQNPFHSASTTTAAGAPFPNSNNNINKSIPIVSSSDTGTNSSAAEFTPDRPIGYGAFGVVWSVTDPRSGKRVALKKMPNVFQNLASCKRVFREIKMLASFKHDNVISCLDILQPPSAHSFKELYVLTELMQSDLHKIIVSPQTLTADHVKVFVYQLLRGVKYLHSANILHRDIKPGNLLVNSNCILKICDFGLARVWEEKETGSMTHEVVTQYYRAPELLMGARRYTTAIDVWSIGCIFAELLGRRILFQAKGPMEQLNLIVDLLGTPSLSEMKYACEGAKNHVLRAPYRPPNLMKLYSLSSHATHDAVHLLSQMLVFNPDKRITLDEALSYSYLDEGRMRFHSCMCSCCYTTAAGGTAGGGQRMFTSEFDQTHPSPLSSKWERELSRLSIVELRDKIFKFVTQRPSQYTVPLCINPNSVAFKRFTSSSVAQQSELPPSPLAWDS